VTVQSEPALESRAQPCRGRWILQAPCARVHRGRRGRRAPEPTPGPNRPRLRSGPRFPLCPLGGAGRYRQTFSPGRPRRTCRARTDMVKQGSVEGPTVAPAQHRDRWLVVPAPWCNAQSERFSLTAATVATTGPVPTGVVARPSWSTKARAKLAMSSAVGNPCWRSKAVCPGDVGAQLGTWPVGGRSG
jgi:hypothetical protein